MSFQPQQEKDAERELIETFADAWGFEVLWMQPDNDDGGWDGLLKCYGKDTIIEVRRKGYLNHWGKYYYFDKGWNTWCLVRDQGIYLNELTILKKQGKGFLFLVDIRKFETKVAVISSERVAALLEQPSIPSESTNTGVVQPVKLIPLSWFYDVSDSLRKSRMARQ